MEHKVFNLQDESIVVRKGSPHEVQEFILEELNKHFKATTIEKYDDATISWLFNEGIQKYSRGKGRISARENKRVQKFMISWMRKHYGPYINVLQRKGRFLFNFSKVYKTDFGRIYNIDRITNIFMTSHAFDRFEERAPEIHDNPSVAQFKREFKKQWNTDPTTYDLVNFFMDGVTEIGLSREEDSVLINVGCGLFVADWYDQFGVCTTFLTPKMKYPASDWFSHEDFFIIDPLTIEEAEEIDGPTYVSFADE